MTSGDATRRGKPQLWMKREETISRSKIRKERLIWVCKSVGFLNKNEVPFKVRVCFVRRQEERIMLRYDRDGMSKGDLSIVAKPFVVRKNKFSEPQESIKGCK
jgi:hypothetical protein